MHLIYSMDQKLDRYRGARTHPQQHRPVPQGGPFSKKFLTEQQKSTNNANSTGQHQKAHDDIPPHNPLPAWVEQVHHTINLSHTDNLLLCLPFHLGPPPHESLCQANAVKGDAERGRAHSHSCDINRAREQCT